jgi:N-glycosylase/DNA lyase
MAEQFKSMAELKAYCDAQYKTIIRLNKQINELKDAKEGLEKQVSGLPTVKSEGGIVQFASYAMSPEEEIAITQINLLNSYSKKAELTKEEAQKLEIYHKILMNIRNSSTKDINTSHKDISNDDLLKLVTDIK